jgi:hypothetical protein
MPLNSLVEVCDEVKSLLMRVELELETRSEEWRRYSLIEDEIVREESTRLVPKTIAVLKSLSLLHISSAFLSILSPGGTIVIPSQIPKTKTHIYLPFPLFDTALSMLSVNGVEQSLEEGKILQLDGALEFTLRNLSSDQPQVGLWIEFPHTEPTPDLSQLFWNKDFVLSPLRTPQGNGIDGQACGEPRPAYDFLCKCLVAGDSCVGKSSFVTQFLDHQFPYKYSAVHLDFVRAFLSLLSCPSP